MPRKQDRNILSFEDFRTRIPNVKLSFCVALLPGDMLMPLGITVGLNSELDYVGIVSPRVMAP